MPVKNHYNYDSAINDASFSHDSQYLALGGDEYTIKINHTITGEALSMPRIFGCIQLHDNQWRGLMPMECAVFNKFWEMLDAVGFMHFNTWLVTLCTASSPAFRRIIHALLDHTVTSC